MLLYHASHLCRFMSRFISLSGLSTFSAFKKNQKSESQSFLLQHLNSLYLLFFKHFHELLWKDDILNINGFGK